MSHFEYVSVATALIYALTIGHLLSGLRPAMDVSRRYWVHLVWVFVLLFVTVMAWWLMWNASGVAWTPLRFLWALSLPALIFVRASVLLGNSDDPPDSYFDHFYEQRALFFAIGLGVSIYIAFSPWILNLAPWFNIMPVHYNAVSLLAVSGIGLFFRNPAVHGGIAVYSLISVIAFFFCTARSGAFITIYWVRLCMDANIAKTNPPPKTAMAPLSSKAGDWGWINTSVPWFTL